MCRGHLLKASWPESVVGEWQRSNHASSRRAHLRGKESEVAAHAEEHNDGGDAEGDPAVGQILVREHGRRLQDSKRDEGLLKANHIRHGAEEKSARSIAENGGQRA